MTGTQDEDWPAADTAIRDRMRELRIPTTHLARETGLSETTIRYIGQPGKHNKAALVAIAAVLRWRYDHLTNILHGQPEKNVRITPPLSVVVERAVRDQITPLREQLRGLAETVDTINGKLDQERRPSGTGGG